MDREIRILLDERAIGAVINQYCHAMDLGQPDAWADCFTADGLFEVLLPDGGVYARVEGTDALRRFVAEFPHRPGVHKHVYVTPQIAVDPEAGTAEVKSYFLMLSGDGQSTGVSSFGQTSDRFVRTPDGWRISERHLTTEAMTVAAAT